MSKTVTIHMEFTLNLVLNSKCLYAGLDRRIKSMATIIGSNSMYLSAISPQFFCNQQKKEWSFSDRFLAECQLNKLTQFMIFNTDGLYFLYNSDTGWPQWMQIYCWRSFSIDSFETLIFVLHRNYFVIVYKITIWHLDHSTGSFSQISFLTLRKHICVIRIFVRITR